MEMSCVFFKVRTDFSNIIYTYFELQRVRFRYSETFSRLLGNIKDIDLVQSVYK
jgi:hypothetical protein